MRFTWTIIGLCYKIIQNRYGSHHLRFLAPDDFFGRDSTKNTSTATITTTITSCGLNNTPSTILSCAPISAMILSLAIER